MYKIKDAGIKGLGTFAAKFIPTGTRIVAERPLFTVKPEADVYSEVKKMQDEDRDWLMNLSTAGKKAPTILDSVNASWTLLKKGISPTSDSLAEYNRVLAAFRNNNFDIGNGIQALFRDISRINHACVPNGQGNFNAAIGRFTIHAVRPIEDDEEITISYLHEHGGIRHSRQHRLREGYGFTCDCPICDENSELGQKSEHRRMQMLHRLRQHAEKTTFEQKFDADRELEILQQLIQLFEDEGLAGRELATMYMSAAEAKKGAGDRREAQRIAKIALKMEEECLGNDNPLVKESVKRMRSLES